MSRLKNFIDRNVKLPEGIERADDRWGSFSHAAGFVLAAAAAVFLIRISLDSPAALRASLIYSLSMCAVFGASAVYHGLPPSTAKKVMRVIDHSSIYILIAGTYTPYAAAMGGGSGRNLLTAVWMLCLIGLVLNFLFWDRFRAMHVTVYLVMGWLVVFFWRPLLAGAPRGQLLWMLIGGVSYTAGVFFYMNRTLPRSHFIWHLFVIGGAAGLHTGIVRFAIPAIGGV